MKVATYYNNNDIRIEDIPKPEVSGGEILLKVMASGICGTDVIEWYRIKKAPIVLGHEVSGIIEEVGSGVKKYKRGEKVVVSHHVPCQKCRLCLFGHETACDTLRNTNFFPGGFSEYIKIPRINVEKGIYKIPDGVSFEEATFAEPVACVLRGQRKIDIKADDTVLILGSGLSGLLHIKLAKPKGVKNILATDVNDFRLGYAKKFGANFVFNAKNFTPEDIKKVNNGLLADKVILSTGAKPAIEQALKSVEHGGAILFFACTEDGINVPLFINEVFWRNDVTLTTSYAGSPKDHVEALKLIARGKIKVKDMITHRLSLKEASLAFKLVAEAKDAVKVILKPHGK